MQTVCPTASAARLLSRADKLLIHVSSCCLVTCVVFHSVHGPVNGMVSKVLGCTICPSFFGFFRPLCLEAVIDFASQLHVIIAPRDVFATLTAFLFFSSPGFRYRTLTHPVRYCRVLSLHHHHCPVPSATFLTSQQVRQTFSSFVSKVILLRRNRPLHINC